jgi:hypothetical protein
MYHTTRMARIPLTPAGLAQTTTLITGFMCDPSKSFKTYEQLLAIYHRCKEGWASHDASNDLRIANFISDLHDCQWREDDIIITLGVFQGRIVAVDGIHRGVAYLDCIRSGTSIKDLPPLYLTY